MTPLTPQQARVLGSLVEKELTTPQQYPLTANALLLACNQASNRDPVIAYTETEVGSALDELRDRRLVRFVLPSHGRSVVRYRQVLDEVLGLDHLQLALVAVLLLRGPQTVGELRSRSGRMAELGSLDAVDRELTLLAQHEPPLVARVARRPGQKEDRWTELLRRTREETDDGPQDRADPDHGLADHRPPAHSGAAHVEAALGGAAHGGAAPGAAAGIDGDVARLRDELGLLRDQVGSLRDEVASLRSALDDLRTGLGG